jgi:hypothetical protein
MFQLHPFGSTLTIDTTITEVIKAIEQGLGRYPLALEIGGELTLSITAHDSESIDPGWPQVEAQLTADDLTIRCGSSVAIVRFDECRAEISLARNLLNVPDALRLFVESSFSAVHIHHGRLIAVHSALVSRGGVGLLLRGPSGAGKSTLTFSCLRRGMDLTSDDWLYAARAQRAGVFAGYPWRILMTEEAASRFGELDGIEPVPHTSAEGCKIAIYPDVQQQVALQTVDAVVLLDPDPVFSLRPVSVAEATERFWLAALPTERQHISDQWVAELLDRPTFVLRRGPSPTDAAEALDQLAMSLRYRARKHSAV